MPEPGGRGRSPRAKPKRAPRPVAPRRVRQRPPLGADMRVPRPARASSASAFVEFVLDQLGNREVREKRMFGGSGLYHGDAFFGIVFRGRVYFKVNAATRAEYEERGMEPFRPSEKQTMRSFREVPADVLEDAQQLREWARRAIAAAG